MSTAQHVWEASRAALNDQDGIIVVLKAFIDESGTHDDSPVLTVAAYLGRQKEWRSWTKKWNKAKRPVKVFHATDAQNYCGEFKGWDETKLNNFVKGLLPVIAESDIPGIAIGIHMDAFREATKGREDLLEIFGTPYGACFQWLVQTILYLQARAESTEKIAFYHEVNQYKAEALAAFDHLKTYANPQGSILSLTFGGKDDYVPLQAADILAYEANKRLREPSRPERRAWTALAPSKKLIVLHYGRSNMAEMVSRLEKIRDGRIDEINLGVGWTNFLAAGRARALSD